MVKCVAYDIKTEGVIATKKTYGHSIKTLHWFMEQIMSRELADVDLTPAQGMIVGYLNHREDTPCARDLEAFFNLSHPTVSGLLSRMEAKGFIEFCPDEHDRRIKRIYPLDKCFACHKRIAQCILDNEQQMVRDFSPEEKTQFENLLSRAIHNLGEKAQQPQREEQL